MIYSTKELIRSGETEYTIRLKLASGELHKLECGYYSDDSKELNSEAFYCKRYPNAVITGYSAFCFHDLTDGVPDYYCLATPRNSLPIRDPFVEQSYQSLDTINLGVEIVDTGDGPFRVYDLERTLIELFRLRTKYPSDLYYEVLASLRFRKDDIDWGKVYDYAGAFRKEKHLFRKIKEAMV